MSKAGSAGNIAPLSTGPMMPTLGIMMSGIMDGMSQKDSYASDQTLDKIVEMTDD